MTTFTETGRDIMELYLNRNWQSDFHLEPFEIDQKVVLDMIDKNSGSISKPTANALGLKVGAFRNLVEQMGLQADVNTIRKKYRRRPANFREEEHFLRYRIHEQLVQPGYA